MPSVTFEEAQKAVYDHFIAAFHPATLNRDTQICLGTEPFTEPTATNWAYLQVFEIDPNQDTLGAIGEREWQRRCLAVCEFAIPEDSGDDDMNVLTQLFRDNFEGVSFDGLDFPEALRVSGSTQDGQWTKKICRAVFDFYERR